MLVKTVPGAFGARPWSRRYYRDTEPLPVYRRPEGRGGQVRIFMELCRSETKLYFVVQRGGHLSTF